MKKILLNTSWPQSWQSLYQYDLQEIYGVINDRGYVNQYQNRQQHVLELIKENFPTNTRILDLAAAQGNFTLLLAEMGYEVTWNDLRSELVEYVEMKRETGKINYIPGNIFDIELETPFDLVLINEVLEHAAHPDQMLEKVKSLVRPGGTIILTTPNGEYFLNRLPKFSDCLDASQFESKQFGPDADGHIFLLWKDEMEKMATELEMQVLETHFFSNPLTNGHLKTRKVLPCLPQAIVKGCERLTSSLPQAMSQKIHSSMMMMLRRN